MACDQRRAGRGLPYVGIAIALLSAVACSDAREEPPASTLSQSIEKTRGYVLISIDTLRADHLGAYGYPRDTSPFIDSLAERAVLFEQAVTHIPSTLPSHVSMLTGLQPKEHRVYPPMV